VERGKGVTTLDIVAELQALITKLNIESAEPIDAADKLEKYYEMGIRMGTRQAVHDLEGLLARVKSALARSVS
jgi:hypothetical protein